MSRKLLIPLLLAAAFLAAPAFVPTAIPGLSDSATAATTVKSSKSNTSDRMGGGPGKGSTGREREGRGRRDE